MRCGVAEARQSTFVLAAAVDLWQRATCSGHPVAIVDKNDVVLENPFSLGFLDSEQCLQLLSDAVIRSLECSVGLYSIPAPHNPPAPLININHSTRASVLLRSLPCVVKSGTCYCMSPYGFVGPPVRLEVMQFVIGRTHADSILNSILAHGSEIGNHFQNHTRNYTTRGGTSKSGVPHATAKVSCCSPELFA